MRPIEQTGSFYLGRRWDAATAKISDELLMYDARDLTTHAVCVGMTGSGKTGLCIGLLEEAAMDGVPALIIDPKGDMTNLALLFPDLKPSDFEPWIDPDEARRQELDLAACAEKTAARWRQGLAEWDQDGERIARLKERCGFRIFTPGSTAGEPVSILASLRAPVGAWDGEEEMIRDRIRGTVGAILGLAGVDADPLRSPAHIFLSTVVELEWRQGHHLELADLIRALQEPPMRKLGVFEVDAFFPAKERLDLAMALNGLIASPGFAAWLEGTPLDIDKLLTTADGRPQHAIISIAHLDDAQRMFFVTLLLETVLAWTRRQGGTTSLRALLYMDEMFGFMPPTANPPSKTPLLTLLKQARAFGVGVVLTTQNPVDLDYKGLSNAGTWFIGKLQTDRDKMRMLDGLEAAGGAGGKRAELEQLIGGLDARVFLVHNVHEQAPVLMHTRWAMSYLRGPLTRDQIRQLAPARSAAVEPGAPVAPMTSAPPAGPASGTLAATSASAAALGFSPVAPNLAAGVSQIFLPVTAAVPSAGATLVYEPQMAAFGQVSFLDKKSGVAADRTVALALPEGKEGIVVDWQEGEALEVPWQTLVATAASGALFGALPRGWETAAFHRTAAKAFGEHLYRRERLEVFEIPELELLGEPGETIEAFLGRARLGVRERRDREVDKLNRTMEAKLAKLETKLSREQRELVEDQAELDARKREEMLSAGETLLGMFGVLGRKRTTGLSTASRKRRMTARAGEDIAASKAEIAAVTGDLESMRAQLAEDVAAIAARWENVLSDVKTKEIAPRRTDIRIDFVGLLWCPTWLAADGAR